MQKLKESSSFGLELILIFLFWSLRVSASSSSTCPKQWLSLRDSCIFISTKNGSWEESNADCQSRSNSSKLLNIRNQQDHEALIHLLRNITRSSSSAEFYMGLRGRRVEGKSHLVFNWTDDNIEYNFSDWRDSNKTNASLYNIGDTTCALFDSSYKWVLFNCTHKARFICQTLPTVPPTTASPESQRCDKDWHQINYLCIYISKIQLSWKKSKEFCRNKSSWLSLVQSQDNNKQIVNYIEDPHEYYIGLRWHNNKTVWITGARVNYSNWRFPNETSKRPVQGEWRVCGFYGPDKKWSMERNCSAEKRFICQKWKKPLPSSNKDAKSTKTTEISTTPSSPSSSPSPSSNPTKPSTEMTSTPHSTEESNLDVIAHNILLKINRLKGENITKSMATEELEDLKKIKPMNMSVSDISSIVESIQNLCDVLIKGIKRQSEVVEPTKIQVTSDTLVLSLAVMPPNSSSSVKFPQNGSEAGNIAVPGSVFEIVANTPNNSDGVGATSVFLPGVGKETNSNSENVPVLNSGVISARFDVQEGTLNNLQDPVVITLPIERKLKDGEQSLCAYIDTKSSKFSTKGCKVHGRNATHVVCHCNHLTSFAVLLDVHGHTDEVPVEHRFALLIVSIVGCCIALLCFIFALMAFQFVIAERLRRKTETVSIHKNLALAEIFALIFFLLAYAVGEPKGLCFAVAFLLHYSLMAVFLWMLVEGLNLHRGTVQVFITTSRMKVYYIIGWVVPFMFVIPIAAVGRMEYMRNDFCWVSRDLIWGFAGPVAVILFINFIILCIAIRVMIKRPKYKANKVDDSNNKKAERELRVAFRTTVVLLPLLGLTWCLGFLSTHSPTGNTIIQYAFAIINTLQGLYFFLAHCLYDEDVRKASNNTSTRIKSYFNRSTSRSNRSRSTSTSNRTNGAYSKRHFHGGNVNLFELPSAFSVTSRPHELNVLKTTESQNVDDTKPRSKSELSSDSDHCFKEVPLVEPKKQLAATDSLPGECHEETTENGSQEKPLNLVNGDVGSPCKPHFRRVNSVFVRLNEKKSMPRRSHSVADRQRSIDSNHSGSSNTGFLSGC